MIEARIIDGRAIAEGLRERVGLDVARLKAEHGLQPGLAVVLVGEDPASQIYVRSKGEQSLAAGMHSVTHRLAADTPQAGIESLVSALNADPAIHGILVQLPLPAAIDAAAVIAAIDPDKDVDGLTVINAGRLSSGLPGLAPCTPLGCLILLRETLGELDGLEAVVLGRSVLVGRPVAQLLLAANCTVTMAHSKSRDLPCDMSARRYPGRRCREAGLGARGLDQARRGGDRRRSQSSSLPGPSQGGCGSDQGRRRCGVQGSSFGGGLDHPRS